MNRTKDSTLIFYGIPLHFPTTRSLLNTLAYMVVGAALFSLAHGMGWLPLDRAVPIFFSLTAASLAYESGVRIADHGLKACVIQLILIVLVQQITRGLML